MRWAGCAQPPEAESGGALQLDALRGDVVCLPDQDAESNRRVAHGRIGLGARQPSSFSRNFGSFFLAEVASNNRGVWFSGSPD